MQCPSTYQGLLISYFLSPTSVFTFRLPRSPITKPYFHFHTFKNLFFHLSIPYQQLSFLFFSFLYPHFLSVSIIFLGSISHLQSTLYYLNSPSRTSSCHFFFSFPFVASFLPFQSTLYITSSLQFIPAAILIIFYLLYTYRP